MVNPNNAVILVNFFCGTYNRRARACLRVSKLLMKHTQLSYSISILSLSYFFYTDSSFLVVFSVYVFLCAYGAGSLYLIRHLFAWTYLPVSHSSHFIPLLLSLSLVRSIAFCAFLTVINPESHKKKKKKVARTTHSRFTELVRRAWIPRFSSSSTGNLEEKRARKNYLP